MAGSVAALCAAAESALLSGQGEHASALLDEALALADDPSDRVAALCVRAHLTVVTGRRADSLAELRAAADELRSSRPELAARLLVEAVILLLYDRRTDALAVAQDAHELAGDADPMTQVHADAALGLAHVFAGNPQAAARYFPTGARLLRLGGTPQQVVHVVQYVIVGLSGLERYAESMALCRQYVAAVRSVSADGLLPFMLCLLSNTAFFTGEFDAMEMAANEALALATGQGQDPVVVFAEACLALVLAVRGEIAEARRRAESVLANLSRTGMHAFFPTANVALALADMSAGDWPSVRDRYRAIGEFFTQTTQVTGVLHWRADEIEALWRSGDRDEAARRLADLRGALDGEGPWEQATAARVTALLAGAETDADVDALFAEALRLHADCPSAFERARTELCWGEWLAGRGRSGPAREHLESAREEFARLGAHPWADRARDLLAVAAQPSEPQPSERQPSEPQPSEIAHDPQPGSGTSGTVLVRAFGPLALVRDGVETRIAMDTAGRALRYLAASGGSVHAEALIEQLWPDAGPGQAGGRLRTVMARARTRYGPILVRDGAVVRWADGVTVDAQRFAALARTALARPGTPDAVATAREAVALYSTDLLPLERHADWVVVTRERLRQRYLDLLALLCADAVERGDLAVAVGYARDLVEANPRDEDGYLRLAGLQLDAGRIGPARETLARAKAATAELALPADPALQALERRLDRAER